MPSVRLLTLALLTTSLGVALPPAAQAQDASRPVHGDRAIARLGDRLDEAAALNGWTPAQLRAVLAHDDTAWVDRDGRVFYVEPALDTAGAAADEPEVDSVAPYPLGDTFTLHSKPGSSRTIFLDFDGATVSGTAWNATNGVATTPQPAWTLDGDATTFSDTERTAVQGVWQRVAEDYAPFDVDVTTEDPGDAGITRSGSGDTVYGTRALISPSTEAHDKICPSGCGGVAYINVFDNPSSHSYYQPAWVFPQKLGNSTKSIAEAVSHEVGHNFGLQHDGTSTLGYYSGHANWAPIMGVGYSRPVVQWSKGEYTGANNTAQDDVALIAAKAPYRADEAGATVATASATLPGPGYVTDRTDLDTFALGTCSGPISVSAVPAPTSPNLDIQLELLDSTGAVVATDDPASGGSGDIATGMSAAISQSVAGGLYFARVDGVGDGTGTTGYTDYASVGAYTLTETGCVAGASAPGQPTDLSVTAGADGRSATVSWAAPVVDGGSAVTGYTVGRTGAADATQNGLGKTWTGLTPGASYTFTVRATNATGTGAAAALQRTMPTLPGTPSGLTVTPAANGQSATVTWTAPSDGGSPITGYTAGRSGTTDQGVTGTSATWTGLTPGATYTFTVTATNGVGTGAVASVSRTMPVPAATPPPTSPPPAAAAAPGAPTAVSAKSGAKGGRTTASVRWSAGADGGSAITGYRVLALQGSRVVKSFAVGAGARSRVARLPRGRYVFVVVAVNALGEGQRSARTRIVSAR